MDMLLSTGERDLLRAVRDGDQRPRPPRDLADGLAGRHRHRHLAHQGAHPRRARRPHPRGARRGQHRARRRLPGRLDRPRRDDARPRRLGHHRGRARGGARRRGLRDLHRRRRRLLGRPADRARTPASCPSSRSRRCSRWRPRAPACCSCARVEYARNHGVRIHCRSELRATAPVPSSSAKRRPWNSPLITAVTHSTDEARVTLTGVPGHARASPARIFDALADGERQRRHDHPERARLEGALAEMSFTVPRDDLRDGARARSSRSPASSASTT